MTGGRGIAPCRREGECSQGRPMCCSSTIIYNSSAPSYLAGPKFSASNMAEEAPRPIPYVRCLDLGVYAVNLTLARMSTMAIPLWPMMIGSNQCTIYDETFHSYYRQYSRLD